MPNIIISGALRLVTATDNAERCDRLVAAFINQRSDKAISEKINAFIANQIALCSYGSVRVEVEMTAAAKVALLTEHTANFSDPNVKLPAISTEFGKKSLDVDCLRIAVSLKELELDTIVADITGDMYPFVTGLNATQLYAALSLCTANIKLEYAAHKAGSVIPGSTETFTKSGYKLVCISATGLSNSGLEKRFALLQTLKPVRGFTASQKLNVRNTKGELSIVGSLDYDTQSDY